MKQFLLIGLCFWTIGIWAQSGVVNFSEVVKLQLQLEGADAEQMKNIPQTHTIKKMLVFNKDESLYKNYEGNKDLELNNDDGDGRQMKIVMKTPESTLYSHVKANEIVHAQELFGKQFLIKGSGKKYKWKITGEQQKVLDYNCQKALLQDTASIVSAWFTTNLPANMGPNGYGGLPGMILAMDIDHGQRMITATSITMRDLAADEITKPDKGKEVTPEEFEKIKAEKMKEMGATMGKGGMKIMIREERH